MNYIDHIFSLLDSLFEEKFNNSFDDDFIKLVQETKETIIRNSKLSVAESLALDVRFEEYMDKFVS